MIIRPRLVPASTMENQEPGVRHENLWTMPSFAYTPTGAILLSLIPVNRARFYRLRKPAKKMHQPKPWQTQPKPRYFPGLTLQEDRNAWGTWFRCMACTCMGRKLSMFPTRAAGSTDSYKLAVQRSRIRSRGNHVPIHQPDEGHLVTKLELLGQNFLG
ncbi:hypothetical protein LZ30DRAFT_421775 [Colletotrichum cereale]|nr:hypothetical protein LZ30DRAFT_421775 [Colletotrichum cereale]